MLFLLKHIVSQIRIAQEPETQTTTHGLSKIVRRRMKNEEKHKN